MIDRIKALFSSQGNDGLKLGSATHTVDELQLAAAALLIEAAHLDENYDDVERTAIARAVRKEFGISEQECEKLLQQAEDAQHEATDLFRFISKLNEKFGHKERLRLIEMLWYVVYSDGNLHPYESNLIQRIAGMLHVTDKERAEARQRVLSG